VRAHAAAARARAPVETRARARRYTHKTVDGGKTWTTIHFAYEQAKAKVRALSATQVVACGGSVGITGSALCWHSSDGGATWTEAPLKGRGNMVRWEHAPVPTRHMIPNMRFL
jgi:photosystem II stability/assembly factor-like uncharacterized protein